MKSFRSQKSYKKGEFEDISFHVKKGEICVWQAWLEQEEPRYLNVPLELRKRNPAERFLSKAGK